MSASVAEQLPVSARTRATSSYTELAKQVRGSGLLERRYAFYWTWIVLAALGLGAIGTGVVLLGNSWFQLLLAGLLGLLLTQFGFLGHDAAHRQIFATAAWNDWAARLMSGVVAGLSLTWWRSKHNTHHAAPNQEGRDPDIAPGLLAFTGEAADSRTTGLWGWFTRHQGWLFFPLLTFEGVQLHVAGLRTLFGAGQLRGRRTEAAVVVVRLAAYVGVLFWLLPPGKAAAFVGVQLAVFGWCLGSAFAPNHIGMPIVPRNASIDFLQRQVLMSRNVRGGILLETVMGGLNHQIEHHLFPSMPRPNLKRARTLVRAHCAELEVPYAEEGPIEAFRSVIGYLNHVGLRARAPFACPLATQLRD